MIMNVILVWSALDRRLILSCLFTWISGTLGSRKDANGNGQTKSALCIS